MSGSDATMFAMLLSSRTGKPSSAHTTRPVATCGGTVRARKRQPATPIFSTVRLVTSNALGNSLNCMTATQGPPPAESRIRLRNPAPPGARERTRDGEGTGEDVRVNLGGRRIDKKK